MSIWATAPKNSRALFLYLKDRAQRMRVETYGEIAAPPWSALAQRPCGQ